MQTAHSGRYSNVGVPCQVLDQTLIPVHCVPYDSPAQWGAEYHSIAVHAHPLCRLAAIHSLFANDITPPTASSTFWTEGR